jgi:hypothetical protein
MAFEEVMRGTGSPESDPYLVPTEVHHDANLDDDAGEGQSRNRNKVPPAAHALQNQLRDQERRLKRGRITRDRDFGLATLGYLYTQIWHGWVLAVLCFILLAAQLAIAVILAINQVDEYVGDDLGLCPGSLFRASRSQQVLAFFIGGIYIVKLGFKVLREVVYRTTDTPLNMASAFPFQLFVCVDRLMDVAFEPLVYVLNLFVVSKTTKELDMVLNTVALEFLLRLDNEFKAMILDTFAITDGIADKAIDAETRLVENCDVHQRLVDLFAFTLLLVLLACFLFTVVVTFWFIPCKFSLESQNL